MQFTRLSETNFKRRVIDYLKREYRKAWFYKSADKFTAGIPDLIICLDGLFYAIELKVGSNKPTPIQEVVIRKIQGAGGRAAVCRSLDEVKQFLREGGIQMLKIGDKVLILAKITQIIEDEDGIQYTISPDDKRSYQSMKVKKEDIKSSLDS